MAEGGLDCTDYRVKSAPMTTELNLLNARSKHSNDLGVHVNQEVAHRAQLATDIARCFVGNNSTHFRTVATDYRNLPGDS